MRSKEWIWGLSINRIAGSSPAESTDVRLLCVFKLEVFATSWSLVPRNSTDSVCLTVCDLETSTSRRSSPEFGCRWVLVVVLNDADLMFNPHASIAYCFSRNCEKMLRTWRSLCRYALISRHVMMTCNIIQNLGRLDDCWNLCQFICNCYYLLTETEISRKVMQLKLDLSGGIFDQNL